MAAKNNRFEPWRRGCKTYTRESPAGLVSAHNVRSVNRLLIMLGFNLPVGICLCNGALQGHKAAKVGQVMDIATIVGVLAGTLVIAIAIVLGGDVGVFVNVPSLLIVVGGGLSVTVMRFPIANVISALILGGKVAFTHKKSSPKEKIDNLVELAELVRKNGPLALENAEINDPFLKKGAQMVADGYEPDVLVDILERERDLYLARLEEASLIYKQLGDAAPAFGMIGTLVGLVQMLSTMDDPSTIGPAMAVALLTTLYGAVLANLVALPISDKLSTKGKIEEINQTLSIDGISLLREGRAPNLVREMLLAYLPEKERFMVEAEMAAA